LRGFSELQLLLIEKQNAWFDGETKSKTWFTGLMSVKVLAAN